MPQVTISSDWIASLLVLFLLYEGTFSLETHRSNDGLTEVPTDIDPLTTFLHLGVNEITELIPTSFTGKIITLRVLMVRNLHCFQALPAA